MTIVTAGSIPEWTLADRLRKAREHCGLEAQDFAEEVGISRQSISAAERGRAVPRELTLRAWALRTGVDLHWLKTGESPSPDGDGDSKLPELDSNQQPAGFKLHAVTAMRPELASAA